MARSPAERTADAVAYALVDLHVMAEILEGLACAADTERVDIPGSWMRWFGRQISDVANAIGVASLGDDSTAEPGA